MKKVLILTMALIFVFSSMAFATVIGSKHDLTTGSRDGSISGANASGRTDQVCVFCHHPHKTDANSVEAELLWNRNGQTASKAYTTYSSASTINTDTELGTDIDAKHTRVCLSCHDGSYAATVVDTAPIQSSLTGSYTVYSITGQANIGGDNNGLANDHPVDFSYTTVQAANSEFPVPSTGNGRVAGIYKLYNGSMQCGTCHEPHTDTTAAGVQFIRGADVQDVLAGSKMCNDCHTNH